MSADAGPSRPKGCRCWAGCPVHDPAMRDAGPSPTPRLTLVDRIRATGSDVGVEARKILDDVDQQLATCSQDSEILRHANIIEIAVRNESGSVSEYMNHWEAR